MSLLKYELKKLLRPGVLAMIVPLLLIVAVIMGLNFITTASHYRENGNPESRYGYSRGHEGPIRQDVASRAEAQVHRESSGRPDHQDAYTADKSVEVQFGIEYANAAERLDKYRYGDESEKSGAPYSLDGITRRLAQLKDAGKAGTYEYKSLEKQLDMNIKSGEPEYFYVDSWETLFEILSTNGWCFFLIVLLVIIAAPVFSNEYSTGMDSILFSTRKGRFGVVTAKLAALMIIASVLALLTNLSLYISSMAAEGIYGSQAPLKSISAYFLSPYSLSMLQFYLVQLGVQLLGCLAAILLTAFLSSRLASPLPVFFISLAAILYPVILVDQVQISAKWVEPVYYLSVFQLVRVYNLFAAYRAYNLFGSPILYPYLLIPLVILFGALMAVLTYRTIKYREVC